MSEMEVGEPSARDKDQNKPFYCGVCEGFYGKPWSKLQRKDLFQKMKMMGLSTYLYAPKDDHKHRLLWRDLYTKEEAAELGELVAAAQDEGIAFVYAISPGLDITYNDNDDVTALYSKLDQVAGVGCSSWALLFDDIETDLCEEDERQFGSLGLAQATLTNNILKHMTQSKIFLFCPTEYCTSRASPNLYESQYLKDIGEKLLPEIDIMWTGGKVVTREISIASMEEVAAIVKRPLVIWDNIHANDYDQTRLYLGAYEGRPPGLRQVLRGVFTNPNCEYEANFIALHTLAQWSKDKVCRFRKTQPDDSLSGSSCTDTSDSEMELEPITPDGYQPREALMCAVKDWIPEFYIARNADGSLSCTSEDVKATALTGNKTNSIDLLSPSTDNATNSDEEMETNGKARGRCSQKPILMKDDVHLLCDLFYLPFRDGSGADELLKNAGWLLAHTQYVRDCDTWRQRDPDEQRKNAKTWYDNAIKLHDRYKEICIMVDKFVNIPNRAILYELYTYISDMRSVIAMLNSTIKWHGLGEPNNDPPYCAGEQEPWVHHGGLYAKFWKLLPVDPPKPKRCLIRPYLESDLSDINQICRYACGEQGLGHMPDMMGDELIVGLVKQHSDLCYVLEVDDHVSGFVAAAPSAQNYWQWWESDMLPGMRQKYPESEKDDRISVLVHSLWHIDVNDAPVTESLNDDYPGYIQMEYRGHRVHGWQEIKRMMAVVEARLKAAGVCGIHTVIREKRENVQTRALYQELGFSVWREKNGYSSGRHSPALVLVRKIT